MQRDLLSQSPTRAAGGTLAGRLHSLAAIILMAALFYAPWALACRPLWAIHGLICFSFAAGVISALAWLAEPIRSAPRWHFYVIAALLLEGWWMVLNAHGLYRSSGDITPIDSWLPAAPGAVDGSVCGQMMWQITAVLVALLVATDLARTARRRFQFIAVIAATGVSIAIYGLLQKATLVPALAHRSYQESVFATFDYHGNAGAFLNLCIPAIFAIALGTRHKLLGWIGLFFCLAAALANVSRAAMAITLFILIALSFRFMRLSPRLALALLSAALLATLAGGGAAWQRWHEMSRSSTLDNPRLLVLQTALPIAGEAGPFGFGPGSFKLIYPNSPHLPPALYKRWRVVPYEIGQVVDIYSHVHDDFVQFVIEWGWIGGGLWALLIGGSIVQGAMNYRNCIIPIERLFIFAALVAIVGVLTHALVDWPLQVASLQIYVAVFMALLLATPCASC